MNYKDKLRKALNKKFIGYFYLGIGLVIVILVASVFVLRPGALLLDDGGGGYVPPPPTPVVLPDPLTTETIIEPIVPSAPDPPSLLAILPYNNINGKIDLTWSFIFDTDTYHIYRSKDGSSYVEIEELPYYIYTYTDNVDESGIYSYKIVCEGIGGFSPASNIQKVCVSFPVILIPLLPPVDPTDPVIEEPPEQNDTDILTGNTNTNFVVGISVVIVVVSITSLYFYFLMKRLINQKRVKK